MQHSSMHSVRGLAFAETARTAVVLIACWRPAAHRKHYLLRACAASFVGFLVGYLLMAIAPNIWLLLPATVP